MVTLGDWQGTFTGENGHKGAVWEARLSPDATIAATASADFSAKIWDATTGQCLTTLPHSHIVRTVDLSPSSSTTAPYQIRVLTAGHEKLIRLWDLADAPRDGSEALATSASVHGFVDRALEREGLGNVSHRGTVKKVVWDEGRGQVVSMGEDRLIKWWDLGSFEKIHEMKLSDEGVISSMEKSHDGQFLAITTGNQIVFLDLASRLPLFSHTLAFSPSSASLHPIHRDSYITGSLDDEWVRVHSVRDGGKVVEVGKGHHGPVHQVSWTPDGEAYASGSEDGTIRLWQTTPKNYGLWRVNDEVGES
ncbi:hypothetical protein JCM10212_006228 [Sporobolomyces blumeae]